MVAGPIKHATVGRMLASRSSLDVLLAWAYTLSHSATSGGAIFSQGRGMSLPIFLTWVATDETSEKCFLFYWYAVAMID